MVSDTRSKPKLAIVVLAAGESKRMGSPKQLLPWKDSTLLGYTIRQAKKVVDKEVFVVLGAHQQEITKELDLSEVQVISNPNWYKGMASSIVAALTFFKQNKLNFDALLICLCDQPLLEFKYYNKLIDSFVDRNSICVTSYDKGFGVPAVFGNSFFYDLGQLKGVGGAKKLMIENEDILIRVDGKGKTMDLDTKKMYAWYYKKYGI